MRLLPGKEHFVKITYVTDYDPAEDTGEDYAKKDIRVHGIYGRSGHNHMVLKSWA